MSKSFPDIWKLKYSQAQNPQVFAHFEYIAECQQDVTLSKQEAVGTSSLHSKIDY